MVHWPQPRWWRRLCKGDSGLLIYENIYLDSWVHHSVEVQNDFPLLRDSSERALDAGLIIVAVAGNTNGTSVAYHEIYEGVISVSAIDETDK